jgi:hypothetical protein
MPLFFGIFFMTLYRYAVFDRKSSVGLLNAHWKPQVVTDILFSYTGIDQYVKAAILLNEDDMFGILQNENSCYNLYILRRKSFSKNLLCHIVFSPYSDENESLSALKLWYEDSFPECLLINVQKSIEY